jgi:hypothetical protein
MTIRAHVVAYDRRGFVLGDSTTHAASPLELFGLVMDARVLFRRRLHALSLYLGPMGRGAFDVYRDTSPEAVEEMCCRVWQGLPAREPDPRAVELLGAILGRNPR